MCGIFGVFKYKKGLLSRDTVTPLRRLVNNLAVEASVRGPDAAGVCISTSKDVTIFKHHVSGRNIKKQTGFLKALRSINAVDTFHSIIGHTRYQTQGTYYDNENNHPIICGKTVGVHNGIIINDYSLFEKIKQDVQRIAEVDSEIIFALMDLYIENGDSLQDAIVKATTQFSGNFACAAINTQNVEEIAFFKDTNPISFVKFSKLNLIVFASTETIIKNAIKVTDGFNEDDSKPWDILPEDSGKIVNLNEGSVTDFELASSAGSFYG